MTKGGYRYGKQTEDSDHDSGHRAKERQVRQVRLLGQSHRLGRQIRVHPGNKQNIPLQKEVRAYQGMQDNVWGQIVCRHAHRTG